MYLQTWDLEESTEVLVHKSKICKLHAIAYDDALKDCSLTTKKFFHLQKDFIWAFKFINYLISRLSSLASQGKKQLLRSFKFLFHHIWDQ